MAVKMIKLGLAAPDQLRRFRQESQALARLQHPGIAQIYESNTADTKFGSQPYFAMEFIRGLSLIGYAEAQHLNTRKRLALMVKVCEAVHHAHQRGLIHRDLKPGNILVDEMGQPKILDFGVARLALQSTSRLSMKSTLTAYTPDGSSVFFNPTRDSSISHANEFSPTARITNFKAWQLAGKTDARSKKRR